MGICRPALRSAPVDDRPHGRLATQFCRSDGLRVMMWRRRPASPGLTGPRARAICKTTLVSSGIGGRHMVALPLNLTILNLVRDYGKIPRGLLHDKVAASNTEIDKQIEELVRKRAIKVEDEHIMLAVPKT